jgi:hypothetical protein
MRIHFNASLHGAWLLAATEYLCRHTVGHMRWTTPTRQACCFATYRRHGSCQLAPLHLLVVKHMPMSSLNP